MSYTGPLNNAPVDLKLLIYLKINRYLNKRGKFHTFDIDLNSRMLPLQYY